ncbi:BPSL0761 family protein [Pseudomonas sp. V98_8]|uniref:BPSL0761 family protein n=1 Tax=Pseudomonas sp. V98_8 TaxID=3044228 RepID=UPI0032B828A8
MVHERTRSVVQTEAFLRDIVRDVTLPERVRLRAEGLLRHYPAPDYIWLAGRLEEHRRAELARLDEKHGPLPAVLGTWLAVEPMFCDGSNSEPAP